METDKFGHFKAKMPTQSSKVIVSKKFFLQKGTLDTHLTCRKRLKLGGLTIGLKFSKKVNLCLGGGKTIQKLPKTLTTFQNRIIVFFLAKPSTI